MIEAVNIYRQFDTLGKFEVDMVVGSALGGNQVAGYFEGNVKELGVGVPPGIQIDSKADQN